MRWITRWWLLPWPRRPERKAAIHRAEEATRESRRKAEQARRITRDLKRMNEDNVARTIADGLMREQ